MYFFLGSGESLLGFVCWLWTWFDGPFSCYCIVDVGVEVRIGDGLFVWGVCTGVLGCTEEVGLDGKY